MAANDNQKTIEFTVPQLDSPQRIDAWLADQLQNHSRSAIRQLIQQGQVLLDGATVKPSRTVNGGESVRVEIPKVREPELQPEDIPLDVLYEDEHIIAINKPAGMVIHPAPGHSSGTLVHALLNHCDDLSGINGELRPGIVHRLDIGTTGVILAAKNDQAHLKISQQFQHRSVEKYYQALVFGRIREESGLVENFIARDPKNRLRMAVVNSGGREARSKWTVEERWQDCSFLNVQIFTGRTHQIRVHCAPYRAPRCW
jgi:23S rRNA pseudouridine1911/1915/1917 synthase